MTKPELKGWLKGPHRNHNVAKGGEVGDVGYVGSNEGGVGPAVRQQHRGRRPWGGARAHHHRLEGHCPPAIALSWCQLRQRRNSSDELPVVSKHQCFAVS